jgi:hypothetical protein
MPDANLPQGDVILRGPKDLAEPLHLQPGHRSFAVGTG